MNKLLRKISRPQEPLWFLRFRYWWNEWKVFEYILGAAIGWLLLFALYWEFGSQPPEPAFPLIHKQKNFRNSVYRMNEVYCEKHRQLCKG